MVRELEIRAFVVIANYIIGFVCETGLLYIAKDNTINNKFTPYGRYIKAHFYP